MANVNYYVNYEPSTITTLAPWGQQDIDGDGIIDGGAVPLSMKIYPNQGYYINADMLTMKGYEPTSIGPNGERIWENGETTTDVNGNSVTVSFTDINKVEMFNANDPTVISENIYNSSNVIFPPASQAAYNAVGANDPWNQAVETVGISPLPFGQNYPWVSGVCGGCGYPLFGDPLPGQVSGNGFTVIAYTNYLFDVFGGDFHRDTTVANPPYIESQDVASLIDYASTNLQSFTTSVIELDDGTIYDLGGSGEWPTVPYMRPNFGEAARVLLGDGSAGAQDLQEPISLDGDAMQDGDLIGVFGQNLDGTYTCYGLSEWRVESNEPFNVYQSIWVMGKNHNGIGMEDGQQMHIFVKQLSTGDIYKATNIVSGFTWPMFGISLNFAAEFNDGFGWGNSFKTYYIQQIEFTNWSQSNLIISDNFIIVKAYLNNDYVVPPENTELILDIDGDAAQIPTPVPSESVNITLNMVEGENSNCIVHVFARNGISYTSGDYAIPAFSQYLGQYEGADTQVIKVASVPLTGEGSKATVQLTTTDGSNGFLSDGQIIPTTMSSSSPYVGRLRQLFLFVIEPKPGFSIHQGWVAPVVFNKYCETTQGNGGMNGFQRQWWGNAEYGNPSFGDSFEIYQNSPVSIMPGGTNNTLTNSWLNCIEGDGFNVSTACFEQNQGAACYWPGFLYQFSKCKNGTWSEDAPGEYSTYANCEDDDGNEYNPELSSTWDDPLLDGNVSLSNLFGGPVQLNDVGFPNTNPSIGGAQLVGESYSGVIYQMKYKNSTNTEQQQWTQMSKNVENVIRISNNSQGGITSSMATVSGETPWASHNALTDDNTVGSEIWLSPLYSYSAFDFLNNCVTVDLGRSLKSEYIAQDVGNGFELNEIVLNIGGKALPINGTQATEEFSIIIDADEIN